MKQFVGVGTHSRVDRSQSSPDPQDVSDEHPARQTPVVGSQYPPPSGHPTAAQMAFSSQSPATQTSPLGHACPQAPQFCGSDSTS
jgi:hypothetical protein